MEKFGFTNEIDKERDAGPEENPTGRLPSMALKQKFGPLLFSQ